jgi:Ca2+-binding EF-hand superfamily protein
MKMLCCVLAFCVALVAQEAFAAKKADKAGKMKTNPQEDFAKLDKNGDGSLTLEEFSAGARAGKKGRTPQEVFSRLDKNGDGKLTLNEFQQRGGKKEGKKTKKPA